LPVIMVGLVASCAGVFACNTCCMIYMSKNARSGRSAAAGFYLTFYYGGAGLGAWLPGLAYLSFGWIGCVALLFMVQGAATLSSALTWRFPRAGDEARQSGEGLVPPSLK
jgi:predicted MFS family arabinose efflux permease